MDLNISPVKRQRMVDSAIDVLEDQILNGTIAEGEKLPSEEQLAAQLGVGRRTVREALKLLEAKGLVEIQMGIGASVKRNDLDSFLNVLTRNVTSYLRINKADVRHIVEIRQLLETAALRRLADHPDEIRLGKLEAYVAEQHRAYEAQDLECYHEWHLRYHYEIVEALENPIISMIFNQILTLAQEPMRAAGSHPEVSGRAIRLHGRIIQALHDQSFPEAERLLRAHLTEAVAVQSRDVPTQ